MAGEGLPLLREQGGVGWGSLDPSTGPSTSSGQAQGEREGEGGFQTRPYGRECCWGGRHHHHFGKLRTGTGRDLTFSRRGELCVTARNVMHLARITPISIFPRQGGRGFWEFRKGVWRSCGGGVAPILTFPRQGGRDKRGGDSGLGVARPFDKLRTGSGQALTFPRQGELCVTAECLVHPTRITPISIFPRRGGRGKRGVAPISIFPRRGGRGDSGLGGARPFDKLRVSGGRGCRVSGGGGRAGFKPAPTGGNAVGGLLEG